MGIDEKWLLISIKLKIFTSNFFKEISNVLMKDSIPPHLLSFISATFHFLKKITRNPPLELLNIENKKLINFHLLYYILDYLYLVDDRPIFLNFVEVYFLIAVKEESSYKLFTLYVKYFIQYFRKTLSNPDLTPQVEQLFKMLTSHYLESISRNVVEKKETKVIFRIFDLFSKDITGSMKELDGSALSSFFTILNTTEV